MYFVLFQLIVIFSNRLICVCVHFQLQVNKEIYLRIKDIHNFLGIFFKR